MKPAQRCICIGAVVFLVASQAIPTGAVERGSSSRRVTLVGLVVPTDRRPRDTWSGSLVTDPGDYENIPGIEVRRTRVELPMRAGKPSLENAQVNLGGKTTSASEPIVFNASANEAPIPVAIVADGKTSTITVPGVSANNPAPAAGDQFRLMPVMPPSGVTVVHGPFQGDAAQTQIKVNDRSARIVAESPREAFFEPSNLHTGRNVVQIEDGGRMASFGLYDPALEFKVERQVLQQGETTNFGLFVSGLDIPASMWRGGNPRELYKLSGKESAGINGKLLLTIRNLSPKTVTMNGARGETVTIPLTRDDFAHGSYRYDGSVTANEAGSFELDAQLTPLLDEVGSPASAPSRTAQTERTPRAHHPPVAEKTPSERREYREDELGPPVALVPGVPLAAAPKCCVITSITVTNNETYPVFYVLNGRYQLGMSPPPEAWVKHGQSRTYKGDFGECVRVEAFNNRSFDEEGNPLTGLFDDDRICCRDLVTGKARAKRFSYSINSVELREWKDCPEGPPASPRIRTTRTPTATPTRTVTPTRTATPTPTATETQTPTPTATDTPRIGTAPPEPTPVTPAEGEDCPQRGKGCAALVIDFFRAESDKKIRALDPKDSWYQFYLLLWSDPLKEIGERLHALGCTIDEAAPDFVRVPEPLTMQLARFGKITIYKPPQALVDAALEHNRQEWRKVRRANLDHLQELHKEHELVVEIVSAHGGGDWGGERACGSWGMDFDIGDDIVRMPFHQDHYWAIRHKVCDWFVYDASCYSGLTPMEIDGLENDAGRLCKEKPPVDCPQHAGWEADLATGTAPSTTTCIGGHVRFQNEQLIRAFNMQIDKSQGLGGLLGNLDRVFAVTPTPSPLPSAGATPSPYEFRPSFYSDKGYHDDVPPPREHPRKY